MSAEDSAARLEQLAELLVMTDVTDMPALAEVHGGFEDVGRWATEEGRAEVAEACDAGANLVEQIILDEADDPVAVFAAIGTAIGVLQRIMTGEQDAKSAEWPPELKIGAEAPSAFTIQLPPHVDEAIFSEFLARQSGVLEQFEGFVLAIERAEDEAALSALKRLVHTLKGEAGMLGLSDVERLCHASEDMLGEKPASELTDALLALKDWLNKTFDAYVGGGPSPGSADAMLAQLCGEAAEAASQAAEAAGAPSVPEPRPLEGDPELLQEFVSEAGEHLDAADIHLLTLETDPKNEDAINAVFRGFHTIKGVAGFMALEEVQSLAHEAENLLDKVRKNEIDLADAAMDITFDAVDMLKQLMGRVNTALTTGDPLPFEPALPDLVSRIKAVASGQMDVRQEPFELPPAQPGQRVGEILVATGNVEPVALEEALGTQAELSTKDRVGEILVRDKTASPRQVDAALDVQRQEPEAGKTGEILVEMGATSAQEVADALKQQEASKQGPKVGEVLARSGEVSAKDVAQAVRSQQKAQRRPIVQVREPVKVDANRLDMLIDTIGEMVIAESMVVQSPELEDNVSTELARRINQLDKITRELQEMGMGLRMVPIRSTFQKMARLVRDLGKKSGKRVGFVSVGEETELDKSVVDKIGDPLVHMVRNSVDHGLEPTEEERVAAGKPPVGRVELRAFHKGGSIHVEIEDDGRGLDREAILAKARERGIIGDDDALADRDVWALIFEPGFSTAKKVTDVSGRGVGMDVVRRNIEGLRGQVEIKSHKGKGSVFSIRLPLTLSIIDGMVVRVGEDRYIIPTLSIIMSIRPDSKDISTVVNRGAMLSLQERLLPLFRLADLFTIRGVAKEADEGIVVIIEDEGRQIGILVDQILGQQQIVIKSLGETMQGIAGIAGGAIMPDGNVGLILDVGGLVKLAASVDA
ncbi:MAG: hypothetical protein GWP08_12240 [Nitrospiraceae bacterium]|nr:hypothetical protein [Nitrospiraceae bacterium]